MATSPTPISHNKSWKGEIAGRQIEILPNDIIVSSDRKSEAILSTIVANYRNQKNAIDSELSKCRTDFTFYVRSLVGPFLSLEQETVQDCPPDVPFGNNPGRTVIPIVIDLSQNGNFSFRRQDGYMTLNGDRVPRLSKLFTEDEIIEGIRNHPSFLLQKPELFNKKIRSTDELIRSLNDVSLSQTGGGKLTSESFRSFVFQRVEGRFVYLNLSLDPAGIRNHSEYLEIKLRIPDSLSGILTKAENGSEGFLGKDANNAVPFLIESK